MNDFIQQYNYNKKTMTKVTKKEALNFDILRFCCIFAE